MKKFKNEDGAITIITVVTVLLVASFLISSLMIVSNRVKTQKEMIGETRKIYEPKSSMEEIYNSFFNNGNIIPIYNVEQLIAIGSGDKINIDGKIYEFRNKDKNPDEPQITYVLKNDIEFKLSDYNLNDNWIPFMERKEFREIFDYNGKRVIIEREDGKRVVYPSVYAKGMKGLGEGVSLVPYSDLEDSIRRGVDERKVYAVLKEEDIKAVIPVGFKVSTDPTENTISNGLVIYDGENSQNRNNEFVWIPVPEKDMKVATYDDPYHYLNNPALEDIEPAETDEDNQENLDFYYGTSYFNYETDFKYEDDYIEMATSVNKYEGFYIGRYETTADGANKIGCKYNTRVLSSLDILKEGINPNIRNSSNYENTYCYRWWGLYYAQRHANIINNENLVQTNMITIQQSEKMKNIFTLYNIDYSKEELGEYIESDREDFLSGYEKYSKDGAEKKDIVYNIFDLRGNLGEAATNIFSDNYFVQYGGNQISQWDPFFDSGIISKSIERSLVSGNKQCCSRMTLYIK